MPPEPPRSGPGSPAEVFLVFLKLGLTSFGGPVAHLGYYRDELVARRRWTDDATYADLVALAQFLPGPASSQAGFALGVMRSGGLAGGLAAWTAFTLPSALMMLAFAFGAAALSGPVAGGIVQGLKLCAVAVVAQAVLGMAQNLTPDRPRIAIALMAVAATLLLGGVPGQLIAISAGAAAGLVLCRSDGADRAGPAPSRVAAAVSHRAGVVALLLFAALLLAPPLLATSSPALAMFDAFYRAGALVFGGGHVVLPLLRAGTVDSGWIEAADFLAGYGVVQAVPGPLFTFAAYLGAVKLGPPDGLAGGFLALVAIFLPGLLLIYGALPFWDALRAKPGLRAAMRGANAAVVGVLGAALYDPVWTSAVHRPRDFVTALAAFLLLTAWKAPSWAAVVGCAVAGALIGLMEL